MANIVIVDDDEVVRNLLAVIMQGKGHVVVGRATSHDDAGRMYRAFAEEGVRVDVGIIDGLEGRGQDVASFQKSIFPDSKVIVLSEKEQTWGDINLIKPPNRSDLLAAVQTLLES